MEIEAGRRTGMSRTAKRAVIAALAVHVLLVGVAHADISRRPAEQIRGPKRLWRLLTLANSSFTVAYFAWGRRRGEA